MQTPNIYREAMQASKHSTDYENFCEFMAKLKPEVYEEVSKMSLKEFDELVSKGEIGKKDFR